MIKRKKYILLGFGSILGTGICTILGMVSCGTTVQPNPEKKSTPWKKLVPAEKQIVPWTNINTAKIIPNSAITQFVGKIQGQGASNPIEFEGENGSGSIKANTILDAGIENTILEYGVSSTQGGVPTTWLENYTQLNTLENTQYVIIKFTSSAGYAFETQPSNLSFEVLKLPNPTPPPSTNVQFSPYIDPVQPTANLAAAETATHNRLEGVTLAFLNRKRGTTEYDFAGKSVDDVKNMYSQISNFKPIIAVGGVVAGDPGSQNLLPTLTPNDITPESEEQIATKFYDIIKKMNSHQFDWDIEGFALSNDPPTIKKSVDVAKLLQDKAKADSDYPLKQMITLPTTGVDSTETDPSKITQTDIENTVETQGFSSPGITAIKEFYKGGVNVIANGMIMEYVWRENYDVQAILTIGGMAKAVKEANPAFTTEQVYAHVGVTPMIGHQSQAPGIYTYDKGVEYTSKWAKQLGVGYIGFWSLTRDHPLKSGSWKNNPTSYGLPTGTDYIYTNTFLDDLSKK